MKGWEKGVEGGGELHHRGMLLLTVNAMFSSLTSGFRFKIRLKKNPVIFLVLIIIRPIIIVIILFFYYKYCFFT